MYNLRFSLLFLVSLTDSTLYASYTEGSSFLTSCSCYFLLHLIIFFLLLLDCILKTHRCQLKIFISVYVVNRCKGFYIFSAVYCNASFPAAMANIIRFFAQHIRSLANQQMGIKKQCPFKLKAEIKTFSFRLLARSKFGDQLGF